MGDSSGVYIHYSTKAQRKIAGMISLHVKTNVPPLSRSFQDATCTLQEEKVMNIFHILKGTTVDNSALIKLEY